MTRIIIPNISVDCVVFGFDENEGTLNVLLIERKLKSEDTDELLIDDYKLTGYHIYDDETLDQGASRVMKELTGLDNIFKKQFKVYGDPDRICKPKDILWATHENFNTRTLTVAYSFLVPTSIVDTKNRKYNPQWFPITELPGLAFDHKKIIEEAYQELKERAFHNPLIFELLPEKFTLNELHKLYEAIYRMKLDNRNFRRKALKRKYIIPLNEKRIGLSGRPSQLYFFSQEVYEKLNEKML